MSAPSALKDKMKEAGLIPVFYHHDVSVAVAIMETAYAAGLPVIEFTNRGENALDVFAAMRKRAGQLPGLALGIGTILDDAMAEAFIAHGADFVVSPIMKVSMGNTCGRHGVPWIPGCATLTEIVTGHEAGAAVIKIFPGSSLGPGFVSAVMPVVPALSLMPTGGVEPTRESLQAWFSAGVICVGMGSQLLKKILIQDQNWPVLQQNIEDTLAIIRQIRQSIL